MIAYIGIDPGLDGAVAIINSTVPVEDPTRIQLYHTPTTKIKKGKGERSIYLDNSMANILEHLYCINNSCHVFLEKVNAMPKQGVVSMFSFGMGYGMWKGIIAAYHLPCTLVTPQAWKKEMMPGMDRSDKKSSLVRAQQLFPKISDQLIKTSDIGKAEALLICEYGRRTLNR